MGAVLCVYGVLDPVSGSRRGGAALLWLALSGRADSLFRGGGAAPPPFCSGGGTGVRLGAKIIMSALGHHAGGGPRKRRVKCVLVTCALCLSLSVCVCVCVFCSTTGSKSNIIYKRKESSNKRGGGVDSLAAKGDVCVRRGKKQRDFFIQLGSETPVG